MNQPVYRVETKRLVIRCWSPEDAEAVKRAEDESRQHLATFMLWARQIPQTMHDVVAKLRTWRAEFDTSDDFMLGVFDRTSGDVVGGSGLHPRVGAGGIEIGYWVHPSWTQRGIATEVSAALTKVAFEVGKMRFVEIRCARSNTASARVPRRLGFTHEATLRERIELPDGTFDDSLVFSMLARDYEASRLKQLEVSAFDAAGQKLL